MRGAAGSCVVISASVQLLRPGCHSPQQDTAAILEAAQQCDPTTWSGAQLAANNHVTAAKHPAGSRERLQAVLAAQPDIAGHLCALATALGYADARCAPRE